MSHASEDRFRDLPAWLSTDPERLAFEEALTSLETTAAAFGVRYINDAQVRRRYRQIIAEAVGELRAEVGAGRLTPAQAAEQACGMRNAVLRWARARTSDIGGAMARELKAEGPTFEALAAKYARRRFGRPIAELTEAERNAVMRSILLKAAKSNPGVNVKLRMLGRAGRGLVAVSLGIAIYDIYKAPDRSKEALHQGLLLGSGLAGSMAGGAAAGLVCGPAAPVCAGIGIIVGGVLFSVGADFGWRSTGAGDDDE